MLPLCHYADIMLPCCHYAALPVQTAEAIARQMLLTLTQAEAGVFSLSGTNAVWVRERSAEMLDD